MDFAELHQQNTPLLIANVWDAGSAKAAEDAGYQALGTSSAAIAAMLGYEDGEALSFDELLYIVTRIQSVTRLPLSVDMEAGYGESASDIAAHLARLAERGIVGVNLEDSRVVKGVRQLDVAADFARRLSAIRRQLDEVRCRLFINVRTDTFLLNHPEALQETLMRCRLYQHAGADGLFVPCLTAENDIATLAQDMDVPLNVMCMPGLPTFDRLRELGVKRISMGNFIHCAMQSKLTALMRMIPSQQSFAGVFIDENS